ncbi:MAG TPA: hypothetical protein VHZ50_01990 [Puia sp.]|jgi:hypothetical protein|nr:hypothetical protein [Puia sp.]
MDSNVEKLNKYVSDFLSQKINGVIFEELFSEIYDFEELNSDESELSYLREIRGLMERFNSNTADLKTHSKYYFDEKQLREKISALPK